MIRRALIGLGSNLGDRRAILDGAVAALAGTPGVSRVDVSPFHETAPVGGPSGQGPFLNAAAALETSLDPEALHARLRAIEAEQAARAGQPGAERPEPGAPGAERPSDDVIDAEVVEEDKK